MAKKQLIRLTEGDLHNIIEESVKNILSEEDYIKYHKNRNPYDDNADGNGVTQPVKKGVSLFDIRARIPNIMRALKNNKINDADKQLMRLYKLVDAMINQGF
jgi:hypothetical protein